MTYTDATHPNADVALERIRSIAAGFERDARLYPDARIGFAEIAYILRTALEPVDGPPAALDPQAAPSANPPGSTQEQLPDDLLALIDPPPYLSTACQTAAACGRAAEVHRSELPWLRAHAEELHPRCRLNHKFTGQLCTCGCHQGQP